jgi:hypothetical protein
MKRFYQLMLLGVFAVAMAVPARADDGPEKLELSPAKAATMSPAEWKAFSRNLVNALESDNLGLKVGAMRMVIQYPTQVDVDDAIFDIVRLYRDHEDDRVGLMAVAALGKMQHEWGMDFLKRSEAYEQNVRIKRTIQAVLAEYDAAKPGGQALYASKGN